MSDHAITSSTDQHYQYVPMGSILQNAANDYTEILMESGKSASNSGTGVVTNELKVEFVPSAFGKGVHGGSCWDIKSWDFEVAIPVEVEAAQVNRQNFGIHTLTSVQTTAPLRHQDGYLIDIQEFAESQTGAAGELLQDRAELGVTKDMPIQFFEDGISFNYLATKAAYNFYIDGIGNAAVHTARFGIWARRVIVPLTELFFDRDTIAGLLDGVILEQILG